MGVGEWWGTQAMLHIKQKVNKKEVLNMTKLQDILKFIMIRKFTGKLIHLNSTVFSEENLRQVNQSIFYVIHSH